MRAKRFWLPILAAVGLLGVAWATGEGPADWRIEYKPGLDLPEALERDGSVRLVTPPVVEMGARHRIRIEYTVGERGVAQGESIEIWKHFTSDVEEMQLADPDEPAFLSVETTAADVDFETVVYPNNVQRNDHQVFPYRKCGGIILRSGAMAAGDKVYFDLGGEQGLRMQYYAENLFNFRIALTNPGEMKVLGYGGDANMKVTGGPLAGLRVVAPGIVKQGESFVVEVVPIDRYGSLAKDYQGLELAMSSDAVGAAAFEYDPELMHYVASNALAANEGVARITVRTADGRAEGVSNPIWVEKYPDRRVYFGDLHQHTYLHDGRGVFEELYLHARRVGLLDFGALTPHQGPLGVTGPSLRIEGRSFPRDYWPLMQQASRRMNDWRGFVSILGYEYSVGTAKGGHHNVLYADDEAPTTMQLDPERWNAPVGEMLKILEKTETPALVIPHVGGGPPDWEHETDPRLERSFEIASVHGVFEESWVRHLESGQRLAATASADNHTTGWGNSNPGLIYTMTNTLTAVFADAKNRRDIWAGLADRRTYGTTGNTRMLLDFRVNGEPMGGELVRTGEGRTRLEARVSGTEPLERIDLIKNGRLLHSVAPSRSASGSLLRLSWGDNLYQRRANISLSKGSIRAESGRVRLVRAMNVDNSFERVWQDEDVVRFELSTTSNDRDPVLVDLSEASGAVVFETADPGPPGAREIRVPLEDLRDDGAFEVEQELGITHPYLEKMGIESTFILEAELVWDGGPLDYELAFEDRAPLAPGDYYYLRVEQLDSVKGWSSPVWAN